MALLAASPDAGMLQFVDAQKPPLSTFRCTQGDCTSGFGVQVHEAGFKYAGQFVDGVRAGLGLETMPNGIRFAGNFADSVPNGLGVMLFPDSRVFAGEWKNDFPHGCGLTTEVSRPSAQDQDLLMELRHIGVFREGEMVDPTADCHVEVNKAHEAAKAAFEAAATTAAGGGEYEYAPEGPRKPPTKEEVRLLVLLGWLLARRCIIVCEEPVYSLTTYLLVYIYLCVLTGSSCQTAN